MMYVYVVIRSQVITNRTRLCTRRVLLLMFLSYVCRHSGICCHKGVLSFGVHISTYLFLIRKTEHCWTPTPTLLHRHLSLNVDVNSCKCTTNAPNDISDNNQGRHVLLPFLVCFLRVCRGMSCSLLNFHEVHARSCE